MHQPPQKRQHPLPTRTSTCRPPAPNAFRIRFVYLKLTADRLVNILVAIFILNKYLKVSINSNTEERGALISWNSNFAAYGRMICAISVLFLQGLHSNCCLFNDLVIVSISIPQMTSPYLLPFPHDFRLGRWHGKNLHNRRHQPANLADVHPERVGHVQQSLLEEGTRAVRDHAIALHLSEAETTVAGTTFYRLAGQDLGGATGAGVDLVVDHVAETLVVGWAEEDLGGHLLAGVSGFD